SKRDWSSDVCSSDLEGAEPKYGDTIIQGKPGVLLTMSSQYGANTMAVTDGLEAALKEMDPVFQSEGITLFPRLHRPATFIEAARSEERRVGKERRGP